MNVVRLPARMESLENLIRFVSDLLKANGFSEERALEIEMAAEEVLVNVIRHAYSKETTGTVEIRGRAVSDNEFLLEFEDSGMPFDPTSLPPPDVHLPLSERKIGGLGVFLVRQMADEVRYGREGDRNILTLLVRKRRGSL